MTDRNMKIRSSLSVECLFLPSQNINDDHYVLGHHKHARLRYNFIRKHFRVSHDGGEVLWAMEQTHYATIGLH